MTTIKPGMKVQFISYGAIRTGTVDRVANGLVWLTNGRWLHLISVKPA